GIWQIEPHGCSHRALGKLPQKEIAVELLESKKTIENKLGKPTSCYAFPYGSYNRQTLDEVKRQGYTAAFSVHPGLTSQADDLRRLRRIEINQHDSLKTFAQKITTGYISPRQKMVSGLRNVLYHSPYLKDLLLSVSGKRVG
ncbi:MAG: polysaccharide deacetylase family protein, partial [Mucilaginibacter polytrichastri]|nr:polysaccharide deacetylase family protein [Mucilaginibacter polytrichastri]